MSKPKRKSQVLISFLAGKKSPSLVKILTEEK